VAPAARANVALDASRERRMSERSRSNPASCRASSSSSSSAADVSIDPVEVRDGARTTAPPIARSLDAHRARRGGDAHAKTRGDCVRV